MMHRIARRLSTAERRWTNAYTAGSRTHMLVVYLDDPPPMRWSQAWFAKFAPAAGDAAIDTQRLYPNTPFLDWLASKGTTYSRATNTAVCSSGRASLQTGEYPHEHGVGTIIRADRSGDLAEFRDTGFAAGQPLATAGQA